MPERRAILCTIWNELDTTNGCIPQVIASKTPKVNLWGFSEGIKLPILKATSDNNRVFIRCIRVFMRRNPAGFDGQSVIFSKKLAMERGLPVGLISLSFRMNSKMLIFEPTHGRSANMFFPSKVQLASQNCV